MPWMCVAIAIRPLATPPAETELHLISRKLIYFALFEIFGDRNIYWSINDIFISFGTSRVIEHWSHIVCENWNALESEWKIHMGDGTRSSSRCHTYWTICKYVNRRPEHTWIDNNFEWVTLLSAEMHDTPNTHTHMHSTTMSVTSAH